MELLPTAGRKTVWPMQLMQPMISEALMITSHPPTPASSRQPYMAAQLQHECWSRHLPQPPPKPRRLADAVTALAVLVLSIGLLYLLADARSWTDLRDGLALLWQAL